jgi:hypothetical protein
VNAWTLREMGSTPGRGPGGGGPGPSSEGLDKQLSSDSGGDETPMGQSGRQRDESDVHQKPIMHRVRNIVNDHCLMCKQ